MSNIVYVGTSLDGYIADRDGGLGFLETVPNPNQEDYGFFAFVESVDCILMGRKTLDMVLSFNVPWHYTKPVFVLSSTMTEVPEVVAGKVEIVSGQLADVIEGLNARGFKRIYVDGGQLVQSLLREDMIDEMILTQVPILIGGGISLFGDLPDHLVFDHVSTELLLDQLVQSHYRRKR